MEKVLEHIDLIDTRKRSDKDVIGMLDSPGQARVNVRVAYEEVDGEKVIVLKELISKNWFCELDEIVEGDERPGEQLALARSVIEAHNGRVWVERSEKDAVQLPGSEFHVVLPLEQQTYPTQPE